MEAPDSVTWDLRLKEIELARQHLLNLRVQIELLSTEALITNMTRESMDARLDRALEFINWDEAKIREGQA